MIVVDSSALIAILLNEDDASDYMQVLMMQVLMASGVNLSAFTWFEARTVLWRSPDPSLVEDLDTLIDELSATLHAFDKRQSEAAFKACRTYGKGTHPAKLNLGDCASYALAKTLDVPLLYKGNDFAQTDVRSALTD